MTFEEFEVTLIDHLDAKWPGQVWELEWNKAKTAVRARSATSETHWYIISKEQREAIKAGIDGQPTNTA